MHYNEQNGNCYYQDADGSIIYYHEYSEYSSGDNLVYYYYIAEDGSGQKFEIIHNYDITNFGVEKNLITPDGLKISFFEELNPNKKFTKVRDTITNKEYIIEYIWNTEKIARVYDSVGNEAIFNYYTTGNQNLESITINRKNENNVLEIFKEIRFDYTNNQLTKTSHFYIDPETDELVNEGDNIFQYDTYNHLIDAKNSFDNGIHYSYHSSIKYKVSKVELYNYENSIRKNLSYFNINYQFQQTKFIDDLGNYVIYTFDNYGHTINIIDNKGNAQFYKYYDLFNNLPVDSRVVNWNLNHKVLHTSNP